MISLAASATCSWEAELMRDPNYAQTEFDRAPRGRVRLRSQWTQARKARGDRFPVEFSPRHFLGAACRAKFCSTCRGQDVTDPLRPDCHTLEDEQETGGGSPREVIRQLGSRHESAFYAPLGRTNGQHCLCRFDSWRLGLGRLAFAE